MMSINSRLKSVLKVQNGDGLPEAEILEFEEDGAWVKNGELERELEWEEESE